jgi:hypothetical protein
MTKFNIRWGLLILPAIIIIACGGSGSDSGASGATSGITGGTSSTGQNSMPVH